MTNPNRRANYAHDEYIDDEYINPDYPRSALYPDISKREIFLTRLAGAPIILTSFWLAWALGVGEILFFGFIIGVAALTYNPYPRRRRPQNSLYRGRTVRLHKGVK